MSWRKDKSGEADPPRGYHHGNLREALIRAALELIATKGTAGFTFAEAARFAGVSPAAPYRHFRDRDELMASVALRGFEQFEAALARAWEGGRPDAFTALDRLGKAYLEFARAEPAFYSAMFEAGVPAGANRRDLRRDAHSSPPARAHGCASHLGHGARCRVAVRTRRWRTTRAADVPVGTPGGARFGLFARARSQCGATVRPRAAPSAQRLCGPR
jgi:AcrR family transcriptional regulator